MIYLALAGPIVAAVLLGLVAPRLGRALPPAVSVPLMTLASLVTALACGAVLAIAGFTVAARDSEVAEVGHWSIPVLRQVDPMPAAVGPVSAIAVLALLVSALVCAGRAAHALWQADVACRRLTGQDVDGLVIVADTEADAYALPGRSGRVVVSTTMLAALSAAERRVLLAHERSHLDHCHFAYVVAAQIAAAANPLLRPVASVIEAGVERWADEDAAAAVRDRRLAAAALASAALARTPEASRRMGYGLLSATGGSISDRTAALLAGPPRPHRMVCLFVATAVVLTGGSAVLSARMTEHRFEVAQDAWAQTHGA